MLTINDLGIQFGTEVIFSHVSFSLPQGQKAALVGLNGSGKTTLLNIIAGKISPDKGSVTFPNEYTIGYLPQHLKFKDNQLLWKELQEPFKNVQTIKSKVEKLSKTLSIRTDYDNPEYLELAQKLSDLTDQLTFYSSNRIESQIVKTLLGLGFNHEDFKKNTAEFSGGWKMRIQLAKILLQKPDLLLLDEPTNHLDVSSITWLENFIQNSSSSLILVSHDRAFLDNTTNRTLEISNKNLYDYNVNYSNYTQLKKERKEHEFKAFKNQQKLIRETEEFIEKFRYKASKAAQVQSRIKHLEKLDRVEIENNESTTINFQFPTLYQSGKYPLIIENLFASYGKKEVLKGIDLEIKRGEKIAIVGKNGAGKTTFLKCVLDLKEYSGTVKHGHNVKVSYFSQNEANLLNPELSIYETIDNIAVGEIRTQINDILGAFMFGGDISEKKVRFLSGGEKTRLAIIKLLLEPSNLLILDEPTNHLDIPSKDILKNALLNYEGTVLIVSHDRDFLSGLVTKIVEIDEGLAKVYEGDFSEYLADLKRVVCSSIDDNSNDKKNNQKKELTDGKKDFLQLKQRNREIKKLHEKINVIEDEIDSIDKQLNKIELKLSDGNSSPDLLELYSKLKVKHDALMQDWEENQTELDKVSKS